MFDVITVGSSTIDVFIHTEDFELIKESGHLNVCYPLGSKLLVNDLFSSTGGGGTNTAVAFSRLGLRTAYLGMIGHDANGEIILKELKSENVSFIGNRGNISGYSVIVDAIAHDRTVFTYKGCSDDLDYNKIHKNILNTKWFYFSSMMNKSFKTLEKLSSFARKHGIKIAFNPSLYLAKKGKNYLYKILKNTEILIFNKEEAEALLNEKNTYFHLLDKLAMLGPKIIIITDGHHGVFCLNTYTKKIYSIQAARINVVESTGAGDAFASAFTAGIIRNKSIEMCLKIGMLNAESVIQKIGAKNILLNQEVFKLAEHDKRIILIHTQNQ